MMENSTYSVTSEGSLEHTRTHNACFASVLKPQTLHKNNLVFEALGQQPGPFLLFRVTQKHQYADNKMRKDNAAWMEQAVPADPLTSKLTDRPLPVAWVSQPK